MQRTLAKDIFSNIALKKAGRLRIQKFEDTYTDASLSEGSLFNLVELRDLVMPDSYEPRRKIKYHTSKVSSRMSASTKHASITKKNSRRELPAVFDDNFCRRPEYRIKDLAKINISKNMGTQNRFRLKSFCDEAIINDQVIMH